MESFVLANRPKPNAPYPHVVRAGNLLFVSGLSSRLPVTKDTTDALKQFPDQSSFAGATVGNDGAVVFDVAEQTRATIRNMERALALAGAGLDDLVSVTCYLTNLGADKAAFGSAYAEFFDAQTGPARTTVGVRELPHPHICIEIEGVALDPHYVPPLPDGDHADHALRRPRHRRSTILIATTAVVAITALVAFAWRR
jgi:2-aminomuconate deaminase